MIGCGLSFSEKRPLYVGNTFFLKESNHLFEGKHWGLIDNMGIPCTGSPYYFIIRCLLICVCHYTIIWFLTRHGAWFWGLGYDYTMRFIGCDSIQTCSFVSERIQSHTMIYCEFKESGGQIAPSKTILRLWLHYAIYRLRFNSDFCSFVRVWTHSISYSDISWIQKNRPDKLHQKAFPSSHSLQISDWLKSSEWSVHLDCLQKIDFSTWNCRSGTSSQPCFRQLPCDFSTDISFSYCIALLMTSSNAYNFC